jgi:hypothetical protein
MGLSQCAHGLRHSNAQEGMRELQAQGKSYRYARELVSQELGHSHGDIVEVYLR